MLSDAEALLIGRIGKDAQEYIHNEKRLIGFTIAIQTGKELVNWYDCVITHDFDRALQTIKKGRKFYIRGYLRFKEKNSNPKIYVNLYYPFESSLCSSCNANKEIENTKITERKIIKSDENFDIDDEMPF